MSTADEMRAFANIAQAKKEREEANKRRREYEEKEARRLAIMARSDELFAPVLEKIKAAASRGETKISHYYAGSREDTKWEAQAIAEEARSHGFKAEHKSEETNHGDSAAPGWDTSYWLEIKW